MPEIKQTVYMYGTFYDWGLEDNPSPQSNYDIIVYAHIQGEKRNIGSLEGIFVCLEKPKHGAFVGSGNPVCRRDEMEKFEKMYNGKFVPLKVKK